uniref:alpha-1,2-Mannosidase n=1 Tax=Schistocephalus solidus TaxID=70667 RepID=A0A0X3PN84_SCHSO
MRVVGFHSVFSLIFLLEAHVSISMCIRPEELSGKLFTHVDKKKMLTKVREMFDFSFTNYMRHAYPLDELDPIHCTGRGYDFANRQNINVNDALGNYQLTLVDSLDTLAILGNVSAFKHAVELITHSLNFHIDTVVQVFESTIRVLGGLLSAHLMITDPKKRFKSLRPDHYADELLSLAHDLANRIIVAFEGTPSGIPFPRVNLRLSSVETLGYSHTCLAGAGSLLLEFGTLSLLLKDPTYAETARRVVLQLWKRRSNVTGLLGTDIDLISGKWVNQMTGVGAGQDSFYEYLLKSRIAFDDKQMGQMFDSALRSLNYHLRGNETSCTRKDGLPSAYWNVNMYTGGITNYWIDSLQAAWPGILALAGAVEEAKCQHSIHLSIWRRFGLPPERYNLLSKTPDLSFYPLRPEFAESTYHLYRVTKDPFYLSVGAEIVLNLDKYARAKCGFATIHNVQDMSQEDRMESFFLSETLKYLYLLFDEENLINVNEEDFIFTTQAHILPISRLRQLAKLLPFNPFQSSTDYVEGPPYFITSTPESYVCQAVKSTSNVFE